MRCNKGLQYTLPLYIIDGCGPTLFDCNLMKVIHLDWLEIHAIRSDSTVVTLIAKHGQLFKLGLGTLKGILEPVPFYMYMGSSHCACAEVMQTNPPYEFVEI